MGCPVLRLINNHLQVEGWKKFNYTTRYLKEVSLLSENDLIERFQLFIVVLREKWDV